MAEVLWHDVLANPPPPESGVAWGTIRVATVLIKHGGAEGRRLVESGLLRCRDDFIASAITGLLDAP